MENLNKIHPKLKKDYMVFALYSMVLDVLGEEGAPESHFYLPLNQMGLNIDQFQNMMSSLRDSYKAIKITNNFVTRGEDYQKAVTVFNHVKEKLLNASKGK